VARIAPGIDTPARVAAACILGAAVEAAMIWRFGRSAPLVAFLYIGAAGTVASVNDLLTRRIPNAVVLPSYPAAAALFVTAAGFEGHWWWLVRAAIAMVVLAGAYLAVAMLLPGQLGLGDVKLAGLLGVALGWLGWSPVVTGTVTAWLLAAMVVGVQGVRLRGDRRTVVPLGPYLCFGALIAIMTAGR
jgi:leader peptidase (prepilin peptidase) / N-methyltransferase